MELSKEIKMGQAELDQTGKPLPANGPGGTVARVVDNASSRAHSAIDKVSATAVPAVNRMASGAHQAVDKATQFASGAADSLGAKADQLQDAKTRLTEECRGYVRENPLASVGIALATGFLLSRLLSRR
jgi:ElaB/YqjD/DUF883 family membrane-anchored ribosome-binding protein